MTAEPRSKIPGGMLCTICGLRYYDMSHGGPGVCPSCDCGNFGFPMIERQRKEIEALRKEIECQVTAEQRSRRFFDARARHDCPTWGRCQRDEECWKRMGEEMAVNEPVFFFTNHPEVDI